VVVSIEEFYCKIKKSMKWDFKIVVLLVEWSFFRGGPKAGFYCTIFVDTVLIMIMFDTLLYRCYKASSSI